MKSLGCLVLVLFSALPNSASWAGGKTDARARAEILWQALAGGGHIALMRHALAPGNGDPAHFVLGDCTTQRNLNHTGRDQARRVGAAFRARGVAVSRVLSSEWCRCLETAQGLDLAPVEPLSALNSFYQQPQYAKTQTVALREFIATLDKQAPSVVLVTHQVNISALTGTSVASGALAVFRLSTSGGSEFLGMLAP